jgi:hypothetical protein
MISNFSSMNGSDRFREEVPDPETAAQKEERELLAKLDERRLDYTNPPERPEPIFKLNGVSIATPGNIVAIQSQAKGGKTAFAGAMIAAVISDDPTRDYFGIEAKRNTEGKALIHIDTEQSRYDAYEIIRRAVHRGGIDAPPPYLRSYCIADLDSETGRKIFRLELERAHREHGGIYAVLLDGGADLLQNVNDPAESNAFVAELHSLAIKYDCTNAVVLHENPGENPQAKTRGHFGSQLERKAESNIRLDKDGDEVTTVWSGKCRHGGIPKSRGIRFKWDPDAGMHMSYQSTAEADKAAADAVRLRCIADEVFEEPQRYSEAISRIMVKAKVKERQAETTFSEMRKGGLITQNLIKLWVLTE